MKKLLLAMMAILSVTITAEPVKYRGKHLKKSEFDRLYTERKDEYFLLNTQVLFCGTWDGKGWKVLETPERGQYGIAEWRFKDLGKVDPFLKTPTMIATLYLPDGGTTTVCVEEFQNITKFEGRVIRVGCLVWIGSMKYGKKRIPVLKACPMLTKRQFKKYLQGGYK